MKTVCRFTIVAAVTLLALVGIASPAFGWVESATYDGPTDCLHCHIVSQSIGENRRPGPHGDYLATTTKCSICHTVHDARANSIKLLPGSDHQGFLRVLPRRYRRPGSLWRDRGPRGTVGRPLDRHDQPGARR